MGQYPKFHRLGRFPDLIGINTRKKTGDFSESWGKTFRPKSKSYKRMRSISWYVRSTSYIGDTIKYICQRGYLRYALMVLNENDRVTPIHALILYNVVKEAPFVKRHFEGKKVDPLYGRTGAVIGVMKHKNKVLFEYGNHTQSLPCKCMKYETPVNVYYIKRDTEEERLKTLGYAMKGIHRQMYDDLNYNGEWQNISGFVDVAAIRDIENQEILINDFFDLVYGCSLRTNKTRVHFKYNYIIIMSRLDFMDIYIEATGYHRFLLLDIASKIIEVHI